MTVLHIEHPVPSFEGWKKAFDADPMNRKAAGVKRYRVCRSVYDPGFVSIDLEFETKEAAEKMHIALQNLWKKVEGTVILGPQASVFDVIETVDLS